MKKTKFDSKYYSYNISFNDNIDLDNNKELNYEPNLLNINTISPKEISNIISNNFIGLNNLTNTCYMNSILQILLHNEKFIYNILISDKSSNKNITNTFYNLINEIINLINLNGNNFDNYKVLSPIKFKLDFNNMHKDFSIGQHDAVEFLRIIFNDLIKENNLNLIKAAYKELDSEGLDKKQLSIKYADYFRSREDSFINNLFYIQLINIYICNCGFETYSFQKLCDLPLLLPQGYKEIDLLTIIKYNFSDYVEDWIEICKGCKRKNISQKKYLFKYFE